MTRDTAVARAHRGHRLRRKMEEEDNGGAAANITAGVEEVMRRREEVCLPGEGAREKRRGVLATVRNREGTCPEGDEEGRCATVSLGEGEE